MAAWTIHNLAKSGDDSSQIIVGLLVFAVWAIGAILAAVKKRNDQQRRERQWQDILKTQPQQSPPTPTSPPVPGRMPEPASSPFPDRPITARREQSRPRPQRRVARKMAPMAPPVVEDRGVLVLHAADDEDAVHSLVAKPAARPKAAPVAPAGQARVAPQARLTPQSLRQQFILTELIQPPLALRDPQAHLR